MGEQTTYQFRAFGLNIRCEWDLYQLPSHSFAESDCDVDITSGCLTQHQFDLSAQGRSFQVQDQMALVKIPDLGRFFIHGGAKIEVDIDKGADPQTVNLYLLGSCLGTILHQRGLLPLHGNSVNIGGNAVLVVAHSGVGKSTLASEFFRRGHSLLSDDVCALDKQNLVHPSYPYLKLWQDAIDRLDVPTGDLIRITAQKQKFYVPLGDQFQDAALPLKSVYILTRDDHFSEPVIDSVTGTRKLLMLRPFIYRLLYLRTLIEGAPGLERLVQSLAGTAVFHVRRPYEGMHVETIADLILAQEGQ